MTEIQAIDKQTVHRICSGQVILNLATAVKELLENSLDSGATSIEIRLKEYGHSRVEVTDNGCGVEEKNFEGLTLKHHTSKLKEFSDLTSVETFGFRGEALSSLCALCKLTIITRHKQAEIAHKIDYDSGGKIQKKTCLARQPGTTVVLSDIFHTLPVRHMEFKKNIKREYTKLLALLNGYCLISTGIRISCSNEIKNGSRSTVLATVGCKSVLENVSAVFGSKYCTQLLPFTQKPPSQDVCDAFYVKYDEALNSCEAFTISGYVSSCGPGLGRSSNDRQFFSINKRPCELPKVARIVNEVFHMFNRYQYPFVQLDINTNRQEVDVNVTPDKRQIFMQQEKLILVVVKTSLLSMYSAGGHAIGGVATFGKLRKNESATDSKTNTLENGKESHKISNKFSDVLSQDCNAVPNGIPILSKFCSRSATNSSPSPLSRGTKRSAAECAISDGKQRKIDGVLHPIPKSSYSQSSEIKSTCDEAVSYGDSSISDERGNKHTMSIINHSSDSKTLLDPIIETDKAPCTVLDAEDPERDTPSMVEITDDLSCTDTSVVLKIPHGRRKKVVTDNPSMIELQPVEHLKFSFSSFKSRVRAQHFLTKTPGQRSRMYPRSFKARISSNQNRQAEAELSKYFSKESFHNTSVIGQFNLGFIIARHEDDLFIIDQHAADEKYNFEMLQKTTSLHGQQLIVPQKLQLTAGDRLVIQENMDIFSRNGFSFKQVVDEEIQQESMYLTKVPTSHNCTFDASDVSELVFMLTDAPNILCRPSRIRQMFASRACRKSVMVGTALPRPEMEKIVHHMAEMDQPWNCPHGRPTMRHLVDMAMLLT